MNKEELVLICNQKAKTTQVNTRRVITAFVDTIKEAVARNEKVTLQGFGVFELKFRAERTARNINTNETITVPAQYIPHFRPAKEFKFRAEREAELLKDDKYRFSRLFQSRED